MTNPPTGTLERTDDGFDLVLRRTFRASAEEVWASLTENDRLARWFGTWTGEGSVGGAVHLTMTAEEGEPTSEATILACDPPRLLRIRTDDGWDLETRLRHDGGDTEVSLLHHLASTDGIGEIGPGWEFYLDRLALSRDEGHEAAAMPDFDDYYPAQKAYYDGLVAT